MPIQAQTILDEYASLKSKRSTWESHWDLIADVLSPVQNFRGVHTPGQKVRTRLYDSTAADAAERLSSALHSLATNAATRWFELRASDERVDELPVVREWMRQSTNLMLRLLGAPSSAFNVNIAEIYSDLVSFGTACMFIKDAIGPNMFVARPLTEIYLRENSDRQVDTVYRTVKMTPRQAFQAWGHAIGSSVVKIANEVGSQANEPREYVHAVYPRDDRDPNLPDSMNMAWASVYVDVLEAKIVDEGGFTELPYVTPRWRKYTGEIYGRGPGMVALPEALVLNTMQQQVLIGLQMGIQPPLQIPYDGFLSPLKAQPNAFNYRQPGTDRVEPLFIPRDVNSAQLELGKRAENIRLMFFADLLGLPLVDRMTTQEVAQRRSDRMQLLSPVHFRLESELLSPVVLRTFAMATRAGMFDEIPPELEGEEFEVEYTSPLALAQRASEAGNIQRAFSLISPLAEQDPTILENFDRDYIARKAWNMNNNDPLGLRRLEDVQQERAARAEQASDAQDAATASQASQAVRNVSDIAGRIPA